jgi:ankyrin repeat protein
MSEQQLILLDAIEKGHTSIVLKLLRNHVNLNVTDIYGRTPLMIVCFVFDQSNPIDSI